VPGREQPYVYQLPKDFVFEVNIEHPTMPEMKTLGYRWATVPAISNFKMNLGGVLYQNMSFNGWFMSTEIVRNLMERYDAGPAIAKVTRLDMANHPAWRQVVASEVSVFCLSVHFSVVLIASK
jgi:nitric oxide synthase oxygenase domain/subunit